MLALFVLAVLGFFNVGTVYTFQATLIKFHETLDWFTQKRAELDAMEDDRELINSYISTIDNIYQPTITKWDLITKKYTLPIVIFVGLITALSLISMTLGEKPPGFILGLVAGGQAFAIIAFIENFKHMGMTIAALSNINQWIIDLTVMKEADKIESESNNKNE